MSNFSFIFRKHKYARQALNTIFLHHAIEAGLDMGIIDIEKFISYEDVPGGLRTLTKDFLFDDGKSVMKKLLKELRAYNKLNLERDKNE